MVWLAVIDCLPPDSYIVLSVLSMSCFSCYLIRFIYESLFDSKYLE